MRPGAVVWRRGMLDRALVRAFNRVAALRVLLAMSRVQHAVVQVRSTERSAETS
jgi:hypothetical protein